MKLTLRSAEQLAQHGILMIPSFVDSVTCEALTAFVQAHNKIRLSVIGEGGLETAGSGRVCDSVPIAGVEGIVLPIFNRVYGEVVPERWGRSIDWYEKPQLLHYAPGGEYKQHADSERFDQSTQKWERVIDRDVSAILYLNEDFSGGEFCFTALGFLVNPQQGMLLVFPADHRFRHAALPTTSGHRMAAVSWAAEVGTARVGPEFGHSRIHLNRQH